MDKIITSQKVFTGIDDEAHPLALIIRDGRISQVIQRDQLSFYEDKGYLIEDYGDSFICPGFNDAHQHVMHAALFPSDIAFEYAGVSEEDCVSYAWKFSAEHPDLEWILGHGWRDNLWNCPQAPTKHSLDSVFPDRPCAMYSGDSHTLWVNSKALEMLGIHDTDEPPSGGYFDRDGQGRLTGVLRESAAMKYVTEILASIDEKLLIDAYRTYFQKLNAMGITAVSDVAISLTPGADCVLPHIYKALEEADELTVRCHLYPTLADSLDNLESMQADFTGDMVCAPGFKQFFDGVSSQHTAWISEDYENARFEGDRGAPTIAFDKMRELVMKAVSHGHSVRIHAIGDRAVESCIDIYEEAIDTYGEPLQGAYTIEHVEDIDPVNIARMADLGILASVQPPHITIDTTQPRRDLGEWREKRMWPLSTFLEQDVILAFGTDAPVVAPNSLDVLWCACERSHPKTKARFAGGYPSECLSRAQAIRAYTFGSALAEGRMDLGLLAPSMHADFIVWNTDLLSASGDEFLSAKPLAVYVAGSKV